MQKRHSGVSGGSAHGGGHIVPLYDDFCPINAGDSVPLYGDFHPNHHAPPPPTVGARRGGIGTG